MSSNINSRLAADLNFYKTIVVPLYRQGNFKASKQEMFSHLIQITDPGRRLVHEFVAILLNSPILYIKVLLTFVYWKSFKKIEDNEVIQQFFQNFEPNDDARLAEKGDYFMNNTYEHSPTILAQIGERWYTNFFQEIVRNNPTADMVEKRIKMLVDIANYLLGDNVGTEALESCEIAAHSASTTQYITFLGCISELLNEDDPACAPLRGAIDQFLTSVPSSRK